MYGLGFSGWEFRGLGGFLIHNMRLFMACMRIPLGFYQKSVECSWKVVDAFSWLRRGPLQVPGLVLEGCYSGSMKGI